MCSHLVLPPCAPTLWSSGHAGFPDGQGRRERHGKVARASGQLRVDYMHMHVECTCTCTYHAGVHVHVHIMRTCICMCMRCACAWRSWRLSWEGISSLGRGMVRPVEVFASTDGRVVTLRYFKSSLCSVPFLLVINSRSYIYYFLFLAMGTAAGLEEGIFIRTRLIYKKNTLPS